jgi:hypothetical protein
MAHYRVIERSYIGNRIVEPGEIVEVEFGEGGAPGPNLEAVDDAPGPKVRVKAKTKAGDSPDGGDLV